MLSHRIITAIIGIVIAFCTIYFGGFLYSGLIFILALLGWKEYSDMVFAKRVEIATLWGYVATFLVIVIFALGSYTLAVQLTVSSIMVLGLLYIGGSFSFDKVTHAAFGFFYVVGGFVSLLLLRDNTFYDLSGSLLMNNHSGQKIIWLILLCTWASDTFAYFTGMKWGKHKIVPKISPKKSLEGFIGGFMGCVLIGIIYSVIVGISIHNGLVMSLLIGVFAPFGDLFESKIKRTYEVKDSGVLLPGHGGVLDRFDSLLFAGPIILMYLLLS